MRRAPFLHRRSAIREAALIAAAAMLFFGLLDYVYVEKLRRWDYLGFSLGPTPTLALGFCVVATLAPIAMLRYTIERASNYFNWCIYFFVYIPAVLLPVRQWLREDVILLTAALCGSFLLILSLGMSAPAPVRLRVTVRQFWLGFWGAYLFLVGYSLSIFGGSISLADITDVYEQRSLAGELSAGNFAGYATGMLSGCFNPFLMSVGLQYRRPAFLALGIAGQVFVYATFAMKSTLLSVAIVLVLYLLCLRGGRIRWRGVALFSLGTLLLPLSIGLFLDEDASVLYANIAAIVYMRTYGMVGALTGTYYDFFSQNPQTLYSHINVIRMFVNYPYQASIGEVIGASMGFDMNANANFFATDGIAAAGLTGVLLIGIVVGLALRAMDALIPRTNVALLCGAAGPAIISLANSSFFTTLLTSGLMLLVLLCAIWRPAMAPGVSLVHRTPARPPVSTTP